MAIVSEYGILKWNSANKKRYMALGYKFTRNGDEFKVKLKDLTPTTRAIVEVMCDYCNYTYDLTFKTYNANKQKSISKKDCCKDTKCISMKMEESNLLKYGTKSSNSSETVKENKINLLKNKYGEDIINVSQIKEVRDKIQKTNLINYGYTNHLASPEFIKLYSNENHYKWKGGLSDTRSWLRNKLTTWRKQSLINNNNVCLLSSSKNVDVHHLYSFHRIIDEVIGNLTFEIKANISDHSEQEKEELLLEFLDVHEKYGLGVCLDKILHKLYHSLYGYYNNTPEQFEEFSKRYKSGEFEEILHN